MVCRFTVAPFPHLPPRIQNRPLGEFLERVRRRKTRRDLDKEILKQFLEKVSCVLLDSLSFEKYHKSWILTTEGKTQESPSQDSGEDRRVNEIWSSAISCQLNKFLTIAFALIKVSPHPY